MTCEHKHTGACSPEGVYLYVRCMDCGDILAFSSEGQRRLAKCPSYNPPKTGFGGQTCKHCGFDYWDHTLPNAKLSDGESGNAA